MLPPPCFPDLSSLENANTLGSLRLGKYTEWFNDVHSTDISDVCEDVLKLLSKSHGCETIEIVIPELHEMRTAHVVSIGSETQCSLNPDCEDGKGVKLTYDTRISMALFRSFTASDYVAAQCLMTAPKIPSSALKDGETDMQVTVHSVSAYLMRFIIAGNLLGLPAITVPPCRRRIMHHHMEIFKKVDVIVTPTTVGYDKQGLPIGLQLIGRPWGEETILHLASAVEEAKGKEVLEANSYPVKDKLI
ncbi:hypothetical protein GOBAR_AA30662 [Gossypium barbadense]|uniref:Uncharacterized protein n=1 Tax=Gossypium barbadense TaxID=3634 RepID=A0A2P5WG16_GOSBA|nr:hypothetical protein GOBAR_AA30662 [Gossypium barbadense]